MFLLSDLLGLPGPMHASGSPRDFPIAVLGSGEDTIAVRVEEIRGELEVLMKSLGPQLSRVRNIAGAALLGTGKTVLVLNVSDLLKSAFLHRPSPGPVPPESPSQDAGPGEKPHPERKSILIVEDSLTSRVLMKSILESAGYRVVTAVDGIDALAKLKSGAVDAVVSDVDMPKMNGFDLTARIRSDPGLPGLPVLLVTSLESEADRARGLEAGANAYLPKSRFDQGGFTEILERFL
jgi:two-component system, chemotaxis family, sensor kinase CheA